MNIRSTIFQILLFCMAAGIPVWSQQDQGPMKFSLSEAKKYALENSPILLNSARDVEIAKKMIWENVSTGLPQANLTSSYSYTPKLAGISEIFTGGGGDSTEGPGFFPEFNPNDLKTSFYMSIQVSQLIFSGQYIIGLKAAKVYASLSDLVNTKSRIGIEENITNNYFTVLVAYQSKKILDSTYASLQKTLYETEQMYKNGFVESTDVDQLRILTSNIKSSLSVIQMQIEISERLLKFQMGLPIDNTIVLTDEIDPLVDVMNLEAAVLDSFKLENNIDFRMLSTQEKLMKLNMQVTMANFLPSISGYYQRYKDFDNNFFNNQSPDMFGLTLSFPLWSSGMRLSQVSQKRLTYLKAQTNKEMAAESLLIQYESALSGFLSARDVYTLQKENRDLALRIYKKSITKFREGIGSSLDLNQTQTQYFDAEGSYFKAVMEFVAAKAKLESLLTQSI